MIIYIEFSILQLKYRVVNISIILRVKDELVFLILYEVLTDF